ncbi:MAG: glycosyltransferase, partial [Microcystaceae cyanobacterium]
EVIYPPVNINRFPLQSQKQDFYLTVSRLVSYKQIKLIVTAFNQLGLPLVVIGDGPDLPMLQAIAKPNIQLLGSQPNQVVEKYMSEAKAFVYGACEDFGIALVEAQACGTPVIAYGKGGALETVLDVRKYPETGTGLFFPEQTAQSLMQTVETFRQFEHQFNPESCRTQALKFSGDRFAEDYLAFVSQCSQSFFA